MKAAAYQRLRDLAIEPPTPERLDRIIAAAGRSLEERFCAATLERLPAETRVRMDALLSLAAENAHTADAERSAFQQLKMDPGRVGTANVSAEIAKLRQLRQLGLPAQLFRAVAPKLVQQYRQRATVENITTVR